MNWLLAIIGGITVIALIIFLVKRNIKDKEEFEQQLKNDYRKPREEEGDTDIDRITK